MKSRMLLAIFLAAGFGIANGFAQNLQGIVPAGEKLQKITGQTGFTSIDAPCWNDGMLFFAKNDSTSAEKSITCRMTPDGAITTIRTNNGVTTAIKASGKGTYYCAEYEGRRIVEMDRDGKILRTVADKCDGKPFEGPGDMVVDKQGGIYFTDARQSSYDQYKENTSSIFYVRPDGTVLRVDKNIFFPAGIALSPDGSRLYAANAFGDNVLELVYVADVKPDGTLSNMRRFGGLALTIANESVMTTYEGLRCPCSDMTLGVTHFIATSGADGCAVDASGNLYVATNQGIGIQVFNPQGNYLGNINIGSFIDNCTFGGTDLMTLYASANDGIYSIRTQVPGMRVALGK